MLRVAKELGTAGCGRGPVVGTAATDVSHFAESTGKITVMSTAYSNSLPDYGFQPGLTLADLAHQVGDIPVERIRFSPLPGTATKADLLRVLEQDGKCVELIQGTLIEKAMGTFEGVLAGWLVTHFNIYLAQNEIGTAFGDNSPFEFSEKLIFEPDCGFVSLSRMPGGVFPTESPVAKLIPNLAVEIISASNTKKEMERKLVSYFECGVEEVWYVYPQQLRVLQFLPDQEPLALGVDHTVATALLPGFSLSIKTLFSPPGRRLK
jgi:Uma2 family endonuclease